MLLESLAVVTWLTSKTWASAQFSKEAHSSEVRWHYLEISLRRYNSIFVLEIQLVQLIWLNFINRSDLIIGQGSSE